MEAHQQHVVDEKKELDDKLTRLKVFIESDEFKNVSEDEQVLMEDQISIMEEYSEILGERIELFSASAGA